MPDRYLVVYRDGAISTAANRVEREARADGAQIKHRFGHALRGFSATLSDNALAEVRADPAVAFVEADARVWATADQANPPSWGLDRVDQRNLPLNANYHYDATGAGVTAYIIDTGIRLTHSAFGGRATSGFDAIDGGSADDCHGHGTHVAGTVGGTAFGVAKAVSLIAVRVLGCNSTGTVSQIVAGIDWVTANHAPGRPAVANMSLGMHGISGAINNAVRNSIADGITYAIAAGNSNTNACTFSPASVPEAITVGATTSGDARASYSNYGTCLDVFAPGSAITSSWHTSNTATRTSSGTSMASPHVAGAAALYLQSNPAASPATVRDALVNAATTGVVTNPGTGSPNRLLHTLFGGSNPPPPPPPPSVCASLNEVFSGSLSGKEDADIHPTAGSYTAGAGVHHGCLDGPAGVDFDLYLEWWSGTAWFTVARGILSSPDEAVTYNGPAGTYRWQVQSFQGSGSYTFGLNRP